MSETWLAQPFILQHPRVQLSACLPACLPDGCLVLRTCSKAHIGTAEDCAILVGTILLTAVCWGCFVELLSTLGHSGGTVQLELEVALSYSAK